jgi:CRP-like cAMP-binding protein
LISDAARVDLLQSVPLFAGVGEDALADVAHLLREREFGPGDRLWHEGDQADGMALIAAGRVSIALRQADDHSFKTIAMGPGETIGEIALFEGGPRSATAYAAESATLLWLSRTDFSALISQRSPSALVLRRCIAVVATERLRRQLGHLKTLIGGDGAAGTHTEPATALTELESCEPPDTAYLQRMATFRCFDARALEGFMTAGHFVRCPRGRRLVSEGARSEACYLTINGAVEKVLVRGDRRFRVGVAGPGQAFGYEGLIDGGAAPLTSITRERALLLVVARQPFERLFNGESDESQVFLEVIDRDVTASWRQALRPQARLIGRTGQAA